MPISCQNCKGCAQSVFSPFIENKQLPPELTSALASQETVLFQKGQYLFQEGNPTDGFYCISRGMVKIRKKISNSTQNEEMTVGIASVGDLIGRYSTQANSHNHLSALAAEEVSACHISNAKLSQIFKHLPKVSENFMERLQLGLEENYFHMGVLASSSVRERLARLLFHLFQKYSKDESAHKTLHLNLSREDYAHLAGTSIETVARTLGEMEKEGIFQVKAKKFTLMNEQALKSLCGL